VSKSVTTVLFVLSAVRAVRAVLVSRCIGFTDASGLVEEAPSNTSVSNVVSLEQVERCFIVKLAAAEFDLWDCRVEQHSRQLALMYTYMASYTRLPVECEI